MQSKVLATELRVHAELEVYVSTPDGHKLVEGVRVIRYNGTGPFVVEVVTDASLVPVPESPSDPKQ